LRGISLAVSEEGIIQEKGEEKEKQYKELSLGSAEDFYQTQEGKEIER
jgi:hypothetical protein